MRNFENAFETGKRLFISVFSICMTVPSTLIHFISLLEKVFNTGIFKTIEN